MDKISKIMLMTASINTMLDRTGCGHPFFDQDINDYDMADDSNDNMDTFDDSNDSSLKGK